MAKYLQQEVLMSPVIIFAGQNSLRLRAILPKFNASLSTEWAQIGLHPFPQYLFVLFARRKA